MKISFAPFWHQKAGNERSEYEDAFCPERAGFRQGRMLHFAIADGATESLLSEKWAKLLTTIYQRHWHECQDFQDLLNKAYWAWGKKKDDYLRQRAKHNPVQWFEEAGLDAGAFATLLGFTLSSGAEETRSQWQAITVGDCCLFQVRRDLPVAKFPFEDSSAFTNRPNLVFSDSSRNDDIREKIARGTGEVCAGDHFYLATDALAAWFLGECERDRQPWTVLEGFEASRLETFGEWIAGLREAKEIRNDDVTLLRIEVLEA